MQHTKKSITMKLNGDKHDDELSLEGVNANKTFVNNFTPDKDEFEKQNALKIGTQQSDEQGEIIGYGALVSTKHSNSKNTFFSNLNNLAEKSEGEHDPVLN